MPNPSEIARGDHEQYELAVRDAYDTRRPKSVREMSLRVARRLADELGLPQPGPINGLTAEEAVVSKFAGLMDIVQGDGSKLLPFDYRDVRLSKGQRLILIDALLFLETHGEYDREMVEERRILIEKLRLK